MIGKMGWLRKLGGRFEVLGKKCHQCSEFASLFLSESLSLNLI